MDAPEKAGCGKLRAIARPRETGPRAARPGRVDTAPAPGIVASRPMRPTMSMKRTSVLAAFFTPLLHAGLHAQAPGEASIQPSAFYLTLGVGATLAIDDAREKVQDGALVTIDGVIPFNLAPFADAGLGLRLEAQESSFGEETYRGTDPAFTGRSIYSAVRTYSAGVQLTRPGHERRLRPYAALSISRVTFVLDADDEKLERLTGVGGVFRAGTYLAITRGRTPFVLDLTAAYHRNGSRRNWRPGETTSVTTPANFIEFSGRLGFGSHRAY